MEQALTDLAQSILSNAADLSQLDEYCDSFLNDERYEELLQAFEILINKVFVLSLFTIIK